MLYPHRVMHTFVKLADAMITFVRPVTARVGPYTPQTWEG